MKTISFLFLVGVCCGALGLSSCSDQGPSKPDTKSVTLPESSQETLSSESLQTPEPAAATTNAPSTPEIIAPPGLENAVDLGGGSSPGLAPPPVDPSQGTRPPVLPDGPGSIVVPGGAPTVDEVAKMLGPAPGGGTWELKEVRRGVAAPGEGPVGPDGKPAEIPQLKQPASAPHSNPAQAAKPQPKAMPLSPDQAPPLQQ